MTSGGKLIKKARARIGAALLLVCVLALSAEGDVAGSRNTGGGGIDGAAALSGDGGFTYSNWLQGRRLHTPPGAIDDVGINNIGGIDGIGGIGNDDGITINKAPGSFWGDVAARLGDNAISRARGSLLGVFPQGSDVRDILLRYGNGEDFDMAEWREIRKRQLQDDIRNAPVAFYADAERAMAWALADTAVDRLAFVRRAQIDFQTPLGGRAGQIGADASGALHEADDGIIGWQLRAFGGEDSTKGGNAGFYYRRIIGESLAGVNIFADYQDERSGNSNNNNNIDIINDSNISGAFWRWSIGGEVKNRHGDFSANRYFVITDPRLLPDGSYVYSRAGYDAALGFRIPRAEWLRVHASYYNFRGEFGDKDDSGVRWGLDFEPGGGLVVGVEYDNESGELGGRINYAHNFGEPLRPAAGVGTFDPRAHFFDSVRREYSQRITRTQLRDNPLAFLLINSALSVVINAPFVAASGGGVSVDAVEQLLGFTATVSPGPPFAVSGSGGGGAINFAGLARYPLVLDRQLTLATEGGAAGNNAAAVFRHRFGAWVLTIGRETTLAIDNIGVLSVASGEGVFERFRPEIISVVIGDGATIRLAGTRIAFTTILSDSGGGGAVDDIVVFNLQAGTATIETAADSGGGGAAVGSRVNVQDGGIAVLPVPGGGGDIFTIVASCEDAPTDRANIRFACEAANAPPPQIIGGAVDGRAIIPAGINAATLIATLIDLGNAADNYTLRVIRGGDIFAVSQPDANGVVEASVRANPPSGDATLVVGIRDIGGDISNESRRTVLARVLEELSFSITPSGIATITTQQTPGAVVFAMRGLGGDGNYVYDFGGGASPAGFAFRGGDVINDASIDNPAQRVLNLRVRDGLGASRSAVVTADVIDPAQLALDLSGINAMIASANVFLNAGNAIVRGGLSPRLAVRYQTPGDVSIRINAGSGLVEIRGRQLIAVTITIIATDRHTRVNDVEGALTISVSPGLVLPVPAGFDNLRITTNDPRALQLQLPDFVARGGTDISYQFPVPNAQVNTFFRFEQRDVDGAPVGRLVILPALASSPVPPGRLDLTVIASGTNMQGIADSATASFAINFVNPPALALSVADRNINLRPANGNISVLLVRSSGGLPPRAAINILGNPAGYIIQNNAAASEARLLITNPAEANPRHTLTLAIANNHPAIDAARLVVSFTVITELVLPGAGPFDVISGRGVVAGGEPLVTVQGFGGTQPLTYGGTNLGAADGANLSVNANSGVVYVVADTYSRAGSGFTGIRAKTTADELVIEVTDSETPTPAVATATLTINYVNAPPITAQLLSQATEGTRNVPINNVVAFSAGGGYTGINDEGNTLENGYSFYTLSDAVVGGAARGSFGESGDGTGPSNLIGSLLPRVTGLITIRSYILDNHTPANTADENHFRFSLTLRIYDEIGANFDYIDGGARFAWNTNAPGYVIGTLRLSGGDGNYTHTFADASPGGTFSQQPGSNPPVIVYRRLLHSTSAGVITITGTITTDDGLAVTDPIRTQVELTLFYPPVEQPVMTPAQVSITTYAPVAAGGVILATADVGGGTPPFSFAITDNGGIPVAVSIFNGVVNGATRQRFEIIQTSSAAVQNGNDEIVVRFSDSRQRQAFGTLSVVLQDPPPIVMGFQSPPVLVFEPGSDFTNGLIGRVTVGGGSQVPYPYPNIFPGEIQGNTGNRVLIGGRHLEGGVFAYRPNYTDRAIGLPRLTITLVLPDPNDHPRVDAATLIISLTVSRDVILPGGNVEVINNRAVAAAEAIFTLQARSGNTPYTYAGSNHGESDGANLSLNTDDGILYVISDSFTRGGIPANGIRRKTTADDFVITVTDSSTPQTESVATIRVDYVNAPPVVANVLSRTTLIFIGAAADVIAFSVNGGYIGNDTFGASFPNGYRLYTQADAILGGAARGALSESPNTNGAASFVARLNPAVTGMITIRSYIEDNHPLASSDSANENHFRFSLTVRVATPIGANFTQKPGGGALTIIPGIGINYHIGTLTRTGDAPLDLRFEHNAPGNGLFGFIQSSVIRYQGNITGNRPATITATAIVNNPNMPEIPAASAIFALTLLAPLNVGASPAPLPLNPGLAGGSNGAAAVIITPTGGHGPYFFRPFATDNSPFGDYLRGGVIYDQSGSGSDGGAAGTVQWSGSVIDASRNSSTPDDVYAVTVRDSSSPPRELIFSITARYNDPPVRMTRAYLDNNRIITGTPNSNQRVGIDGGGSGTGYSITLLSSRYVSGNNDAHSVSLAAVGNSVSVIVSASRAGQVRAVVGGFDDAGNGATITVDSEVVAPIVITRNSDAGPGAEDIPFLVIVAGAFQPTQTFMRIHPISGGGGGGSCSLSESSGVNSNFVGLPETTGCRVLISNRENNAGIYPFVLTYTDGADVRGGVTYQLTARITSTLAAVVSRANISFVPSDNIPAATPGYVSVGYLAVNGGFQTIPGIASSDHYIDNIHLGGSGPIFQFGALNGGRVPVSANVRGAIFNREVRFFDRHISDAGRDFTNSPILRITGFIPAEFRFDPSIIGGAFSTVVATSATPVQAGIMAAQGGVAPYTYSIFGGNDDIVANIGTGGEVSIQAAAVGVFAITISASQTHAAFGDIGISITMSAAAGVGFNISPNLAADNLSVTTYAGGAIGSEDFVVAQLSPSGGANYAFSFDGNGGDYFVVQNNRDLVYRTNANGTNPATTTITIIVSGDNPNRGNTREHATIAFQMHINNPPPVLLEVAQNPLVYRGAAGVVATLSASGGYVRANGGTQYTYSLAPGSENGLQFSASQPSIVLFASPSNTTVTMLANDGHQYNIANAPQVSITVSPYLRLNATFVPAEFSVTIGGTLSNDNYVVLASMEHNQTGGGNARCFSPNNPTFPALQGIDDQQFRVVGGGGLCELRVLANTAPGGNAPSIGVYRTQFAYSEGAIALPTYIATASVHFVAPPTFAHTYNAAPNTDIIFRGVNVTVATIEITGGQLIPGGSYAVNIGANQGEIEFLPDSIGNNRFIHRISTATPRNIIANITISDDNSITPDLIITRSITAIAPARVIWTPGNPYRVTTRSFVGNAFDYFIFVRLEDGANPRFNGAGNVNPNTYGLGASVEPTNQQRGRRIFYPNNRPFPPQNPGTGLLAMAYTDDLGSYITTLTINVVDPPRVDIGLVGTFTPRHPAPDSPAQITIATITAGGGFVGGNQRLQIVGGSSLAIVDNTLLVLNDAQAAISVHSVTVRGIDNHPRTDSDDLILSITLLGAILGDSQVDAFGGAGRFIFVPEPIYTVAAAGGTPPYTYSAHNFPTTINLAGAVISHGSGTNSNPPGTTLTVSVIAVDSSTPERRATADIVINWIDRAVGLNSRKITDGGVVGNNFGVLSATVNNGTFLIGNQRDMILVSAGYIIDGGGEGGGVNLPDNSNLSVIIDSQAAGGISTDRNIAVNISASQAGTIRAILRATDTQSSLDITISAGIFAPLVITNVGIPSAFNGIPLIRGAVNSTPPGSGVYSFGWQFSGGNRGIFGVDILTAPANGFAANAQPGNVIPGILLFAAGSTFPATPGTLIYEAAIKDPAFGDAAPFQQSVIVQITQAAISHTISASYAAADNIAYRSNAFFNLGSILISGGLTTAANIGNVATLGITNANLTASIATDGGIYLNAPAGNFNIELIASDRYLGEQVHAATITINGNVPESLGFDSSIIGGAFATIIPTSSTPVQAGIMAARGGTSPYTYQIFGGNDDIVVNIGTGGEVSIRAGIIAGFVITISATDSAANADETGITITMSAAAGIGLGASPNIFADNLSVTTFPGEAIGSEDFVVAKLSPNGGSNYQLAFDGDGGSYLRIESNNDLVYRTAANATNPATTTITIIVSGDNAAINARQHSTLAFQMHVNHPPPVSISLLANNNAVLRHNANAVVATFSVASGGYIRANGQRNNISYSFTPNVQGLRVVDSSIIIYSNPTSTTVTIRANDGHQSANRGELSLAISAHIPLTAGFHPSEIFLTLGGTLSADENVHVASITINQGSGLVDGIGTANRCWTQTRFNVPGINYSQFNRFGNCRVEVSAGQTPGGNSPSVFALNTRISRFAEGVNWPHEFIFVNINFVNPPDFVHTYQSAPNVDIITPGTEVTIATIAVSGGQVMPGGAYSVSIAAGHGSIEFLPDSVGNNRFVHRLSAANAGVIIANIIVRDDNSRTPDLIITRSITATTPVGLTWEPSNPLRLTTRLGYQPFDALATARLVGGLNHTFTGTDPEVPGTENNTHNLDTRALQSGDANALEIYRPDSPLVIQNESEGIFVMRHQDQLGTYLSTLSVNFVHPQRATIQIIGNLNTAPTAPNPAAQITIATLTTSGGFFSTSTPRAIAVVGGGSSLAIISMSLLVLNDAQAAIPAHTVTLRATDDHPETDSEDFIISITLSVPAGPLGVGFAEAPNTTFLTMFQGTIGALTITDTPGGTGTNGQTKQPQTGQLITNPAITHPANNPTHQPITQIAALFPSFSRNSAGISFTNPSFPHIPSFSRDSAGISFTNPSFQPPSSFLRKQESKTRPTTRPKNNTPNNNPPPPPPINPKTML